MKSSNYPEPNEEKLLEILELAKEAANSARELCHMAAKHNEKWRKKAEAKAQKEAKKTNYS